MKIQTYDDIQVTILQAPVTPGKLSQQAMKLTMTKKIDPELPPIKERSLDFLISANHGSVIEHETFTFALEGVSRSFLAQITRHRIGSFTSASQHYAEYHDMPMVIHPDTNANERAILEQAFAHSMGSYIDLIDMGYPKEEARQALPNAAATNIIWTVNARSLANFLAQRLCKRNVHEARIVSNKIMDQLERVWSAYFNIVGPDCYTKDECTQGKMFCGSFWEPGLAEVIELVRTK